tara:strand:+ start:2208 stop:2822 length:615 start_codon:yes stop_codon:yes gene_type:complete
MAYIGRSPLYGAFERQSLTADSSTVSFTLNYTIGSSSSVLVSVAGVMQEPEVGYTLTGGGTTLLFSAAPTAGDTIFIVFLGLARDVGSFLNSGIITAQTSEGTVADNDEILIYDNSAAALRRMTKANFAPTVSLTYVTRTRTGNGTLATDTVTSGCAVDNVLVYVNGLVQQPTTDYTISGTTLTHVVAPAASDKIVIRELPREG